MGLRPGLSRVEFTLLAWITKRNVRELRAAFAAALDTLTCSRILANNDLWLG